MLIRDVMTWNVVTVPSTTPILEARKIMDAHGFNRLPVVDRGKLVGVISRHRIDTASPSLATSLSVWEINYLVAKIQVKDVMVKDVVTVSPDDTVERGVQIAQSRRVGSLIVVEDGRVVGIVTTNDVFYRILNKILGINEPGVRFEVYDCAEPKKVAEVMGVLANHRAKMITFYSIPA
ncbi:MAG: CBS domain-containing protein, partial [Dehalococcoidia bacterium]|nr:CBS domain-containing protein [Dehalococcoidia bacterium]